MPKGETLNGKSIDEISKLFKVSKSALRFWEKKGYLSSRRNDENDYRIYLKDSVFDIADFIVYKNFGIPLKEIKKISASDVGYAEAILKTRAIAIENQMKLLQYHKQLLDNKLNNIKEYKRLSLEGPVLCEAELVRIMKWSFDNQSAFLYANDPLTYPFYAISHPPYSECIEGVVAPEDYNGNDIIWDQNTFDQTPKMSFLMKCRFASPNDNNIIEKIKTIKNMGYETGSILFKYLVTGTENGIKMDYYKASVEIN